MSPSGPVAILHGDEHSDSVFMGCPAAVRPDRCQPGVSTGYPWLDIRGWSGRRGRTVLSSSEGLGLIGRGLLPVYHGLTRIDRLYHRLPD